jgi:quercetin dioxygenase-like cupin family protein
VPHPAILRENPGTRTKAKHGSGRYDDEQSASPAVSTARPAYPLRVKLYSIPAQLAPMSPKHEDKEMRMRSLAMVLITTALGASPGLAQNVEQVKPVFEHVLPNVKGKRMVAVVVTYAPGAKSPAHHHARSAFIYAYVLSGTIRSQVDDAPPRIYQVGEGFFEMPGSHHRISENASDREPASLLAIFVVDSNDNALTTPDQTQDPPR